MARGRTVITIHKYKLGLTTQQQVTMPGDADLLSVQLQPVGGGVPILALWARVEDANVQRRRRIIMCGTGKTAPINARFISTVIDGAFVWHFFDGGEVAF
jgi:hypothetical protein